MKRRLLLYGLLLISGAAAVYAPLQGRLIERGAEVDKLKLDVNRLRFELAAARASPSELRTTRNGVPGTDTPSLPSSTDMLSAPTIRESIDIFSSLRTPVPARPLWQWLLGTSVVMLLLGFALGWRMLDRKIRRKFGGLRIY